MLSVGRQANTLHIRSNILPLTHYVCLRIHWQLPLGIYFSPTCTFTVSPSLVMEFEAAWAFGDHMLLYIRWYCHYHYSDGGRFGSALQRRLLRHNQPIKKSFISYTTEQLRRSPSVSPFVATRAVNGGFGTLLWAKSAGIRNFADSKVPRWHLWCVKIAESWRIRSEMPCWRT